MGQERWQGGPFETGKKNPRPQDYRGKYTFSGKPEMGPQAFRRELPPAAKSSGANEATTDMDGAMRQGPEPSFDNILKKWR